MSASVSIREATTDDAVAWDAYVEAAREGTFFHLFGWRRVIERGYGRRGVYLLAARGARIVGVLPLIDVNSALFGRNLISTAFTVGGGIVADDDEAAGALAEAALEAGRRRRVGYVELRASSAALEGWRVKNDVYAGFEAPLPADEKTALAALPRRRRADVRKALQSVAAGELSYDFSGDWRDFHALYAQSLRDHGTPVFSRRVTEGLVSEFADQTEILVIRAKDEPVLALLSFYFRDRVMPYYIGGRADARARRAYDLAVWLQMRRGVERGAKVFDLGRSKYGAGSFDYKRHWGVKPRPLDYRYALVRARATPNVNPANPKFSAAVAAWRRLPLPLANLAGPFVARHLA